MEMKVDTSEELSLPFCDALLLLLTVCPVHLTNFPVLSHRRKACPTEFALEAIKIIKYDVVTLVMLTMLACKNVFLNPLPSSCRQINH